MYFQKNLLHKLQDIISIIIIYKLLMDNYSLRYSYCIKFVPNSIKIVQVSYKYSIKATQMY